MFAASAHAATCKYVDNDGNTIYSNYPLRNAKKVVCFDATPASAPEPEPEPTKARAVSPAKSTTTKPSETRRDFLRVDKTTQRRRDMSRKQLLEEELTDELRLLDQARQTLSTDASARDSGASRDSRAISDRTQPMREAVELHQRNIEAIENELRRLR